MHYLTVARRVGDTVRLAQVVQILIKHGFAETVQKLGIRKSLPARVLHKLHVTKAPEGPTETTGQRLRAALTELGPTYVKLGQVLSTRADIVPAGLREELAKLQDRVEAVPFEDMQSVIEGSLRMPLSDAFREFGENPMACASLSQVYKAKLPTGQPVAVKVRKPKMRELVQADLSLMQALAEWIDEHVEDLDWLDAQGLVEAFRRSIMRELDFSIEARTIQRFHENFKTDPNVEIPFVYAERSSSDVVTMTYIDGVRVDNLEAYDERNCDPKTIANIGLHAVCKQVFEHSLFHADPHPGNVFITRDNRLAFLDYGMIGSLEKADIGVMTELLRAVLKEDSKAVTDCVLILTDTADLEDLSALQQELSEYLAFEAQSIISHGEVGKALEKILDLLARHKLKLPPRFSLLIKALSTIESTGHALDPDLDVLPVMQPYVEEVIKRRFSPDEILHQSQEYGFRLARIVRDLPQDIHVLLQTARHGRLRMQFKHMGLENLNATLDRASDRVAFSVVAGSLIIGSSWLLASDVPGTRLIALAGYIIAALLGVGLLISIIRARNV